MQYCSYAAKSSGLIVYNNHDLKLPMRLLNFSAVQLLYVNIEIDTIFLIGFMNL